MSLLSLRKIQSCYYSIPLYCEGLAGIRSCLSSAIQEAPSWRNYCRGSDVLLNAKSLEEPTSRAWLIKSTLQALQFASERRDKKRGQKHDKRKKPPSSKRSNALVEDTCETLQTNSHRCAITPYSRALGWFPVLEQPWNRDRISYSKRTSFSQ